MLFQERLESEFPFEALCFRGFWSKSKWIPQCLRYEAGTLGGRNCTDNVVGPSPILSLGGWKRKVSLDDISLTSLESFIPAVI